MRLAAIYIKHNYLFSQSQTINLGGKYFYEILERKNENEYELNRYKNPSFIDNFWGDSICLVSALVGENGSGKTTLLKQITTYANAYPSNFFIWEDDDALFFTQIYYASFSRDHPKIFFKDKEVKNKSKILEFTQSIYYSPFLSYEYRGYRNISYRTKFYNTSRATSYLTLNSLLENSRSDLNNFISENFKRELIFCENFKDFSTEYSFLDYNVAFSTIKDKLYPKLSDWFSYKNKEDKNEEEYLIFKNIDSSLQDDEKKYYEEFKNIEKKLELGINTSINYNYALPYGFYIEFILYLKYYFEELVSSIVKTDLIDGNLSEIIDSFFATPKKFTKKKDLDRFKNIKKLYYLIIEKISYNYLNYTCARKDAIDIISLQEKISLSEQNENLISGARFFIPYPINILSSGEKSLINLFSNIYSNFSDSYQRYRDEKMDISNEFTNYNQKIQRIILFLDEADIGFHPQWKKKYIKIITDLFPKIFKEIESFRSIQIIFTTHDSLTLSDIPNGNIVYLKKDGDNNIKVLSEHEKPTKSFGANITDLLADSFFVKDGLMGDFAKEKIDEVIKYLNDSDSIITDNAKAKKIIDIIDEPILRYKLEDMYFEKFPQERDLEKEKDEILKRAQELGLNIQR